MDIDWELLVGCWRENPTPEECAWLTRWLAADPAHGRLLDAVFIASDAMLRVPEPARAETTREQRPLPLGAWRRVPHNWAAGVAGMAVLAALIGVGVGVGQFAVTRRGSHGSPVASERVIATRPGETADVRLPDGTRVILAAASLLRYAGPRTGRTRDVVLAGEGYFEIAHDTTHPFRVRAGTITTEDIGTAFDLRAYGGDPGVRIVVSNGAVSIRADSTHAPVVLGRGSLGVVEARGDVRVTTGVAVERYLAWTEGKLVFTDEPLGVAVADIARRFDVAIRLGDPALAERRLTASFAADPIANVVRALESAMDLRAVREGQTITLYPR